MSLKKKTLNGVKWNLLSTIITSVLSIVILWVLSHLLTTSQYGIVSASIIISNFCIMLLDFGISNSIVRSSKITDLELTSLFWTNLTLGFVLFVCVYFFSYDISLLFNAGPLLEKQIKIMSFGFVILSIGVQPKALLARDIKFSKISIINIISNSSNFILVVFLTYFYRSPDVVAISFLISSTINSLVSQYFTLNYYKLSFSFNLKSIIAHLKYGVQLVLDSTINQLSINTYPVLMSRIISLAAIGGYNISYGISISLFERLNPVLSHALFPAFSKISEDIKKFNLSFLKVTTFSAMVNFPMLLGMLVVSDYIVNIFFDNKWAFIIPIVKILCLTGAIRSLDTPVISVLLARAQMHRNVILGFFKLLLGVPLTYLLGKKYGLIGISYGFLIIQATNTVLGYFYLLKPVTGINLKKYLQAVLIPVLQVIPMVFLAMIFKEFTPIHNDMYNLIVVLIISFSTYCFCIFTSPFVVITEFKDTVINNFLKRS